MSITLAQRRRALAAALPRSTSLDDCATVDDLVFTRETIADFKNARDAAGGGLW